MRRSSSEAIAVCQLRHRPARSSEGQPPGMPADSHCRPSADGGDWQVRGAPSGRLSQRHAHTGMRLSERVCSVPAPMASWVTTSDPRVHASGRQPQRTPPARAGHAVLVGAQARRDLLRRDCSEMLEFRTLRAPHPSRSIPSRWPPSAADSVAPARWIGCLYIRHRPRVHSASGPPPGSANPCACQCSAF